MRGAGGVVGAAENLAGVQAMGGVRSRVRTS
jgi:hypothetical protein